MPFDPHARELKADATATAIAAVDEWSRASRVRLLALLAAILVVAAAATWLIPDPKLSRATAIAGACLALWLLEVVPPYVVTLLMWAVIPLLLGPLDSRAFSLPKVLSASANPILVLFFAGLSLSVAATKYGIDAWIASWMVRLSGGRRYLLLATVMAGTAVLSMWMSNIAAAAMMFATLRPLFGDAKRSASFRRALLLGVAFAADFGGMGTPIGTGPNLIAIAAVAPHHAIDFLDWMRFGVPIALVMVALTYALLILMFRVRGRLENAAIATPRLTRKSVCVIAIFCIAVAAWLLEPLHGVPSAIVGLVIAGGLFGTRLLDGKDLGRIDWATLLLVAGGLTLGDLFENSGLVHAMAGSVEWRTLHPTLVLLSLVIACAALSAVASNTAASAVMIQIGLGIVPSPAVAVIIALGASMGVPFVISTPPNAIAYGQGGLRTRDLLLPGLALMAAGCTLLVFVGPAILRWCGIN